MKKAARKSCKRHLQSEKVKSDRTHHPARNGSDTKKGTCHEEESKKPGGKENRGTKVGEDPCCRTSTYRLTHGATMRWGAGSPGGDRKRSNKKRLLICRERQPGRESMMNLGCIQDQVDRGGGETGSEKEALMLIGQRETSGV